jgi:hypothetical protein
MAWTHVEVEHAVGIWHLAESVDEFGLGYVYGGHSTENMRGKELAVDRADPCRRSLKKRCLGRHDETAMFVFHSLDDLTASLETGSSVRRSTMLVAYLY